MGCCLPVGSAMSRKALFVRLPPDFSIFYLRSVGKIGVNRVGLILIILFEPILPTLVC